MPLIADLTLFIMEYHYFKTYSLPKNIPLFRYIDDILAVNLDLDNHTAAIYDSSLKLNKETLINDGINYLDLTIKTGSNNVHIYDKTNVFPFHVKKLYHSSSCVHSKMIKGLVIGQFLRFTRLTPKLHYWIEAVVKLYHAMSDNKFDQPTFASYACCFYARYHTKLWKYKIYSKKQFCKVIQKVFE